MTAIWASWLWAPTPVARATMRPVRFIVPPRTVDPTVVSTGIGSPVIIEVSTLDAPSTISPSAARVSPARVTKRSPLCNFSMGTRVSTPSRNTRAFLAANWPRAVSTERADLLARASK